MSDTAIKLSAQELEDITGYTLATKQVKVLHNRGFVRAFINRKGEVVLERTHYEAVTKGEAQAPVHSGKSANLAFLRAA